MKKKRKVRKSEYEREISTFCFLKKIFKSRCRKLGYVQRSNLLKLSMSRLYYLKGFKQTREREREQRRLLWRWYPSNLIFLQKKMPVNNTFLFVLQQQKGWGVVGCLLLWVLLLSKEWHPTVQFSKNTYPKNSLSQSNRTSEIFCNEKKRYSIFVRLLWKIVKMISLKKKPSFLPILNNFTWVIQCDHQQ